MRLTVTQGSSTLLLRSKSPGLTDQECTVAFFNLAVLRKLREGEKWGVLGVKISNEENSCWYCEREFSMFDQGLNSYQVFGFSY